MNHLLILGLGVVLAFAPWTLSRAQDGENQPANEVEVPQQELSLEQDRKELDALREAVPAAKKIENDDLAYVLGLFADPSRRPESIRNEWSRVTNRLRQKKTNEFRKLRETFNNEEKKKSKEFLKAQKQAREEFKKKKLGQPESREFHREQDEARQAFYADQKDRRGDFESQLRAQQQDFDQFLNDKRKMFNEQIRDFERQHRELNNQQKKGRHQQSVGQSLGQSVESKPAVPYQSSPQDQQIIQDFKNIPRDVPAIPLQPGTGKVQ